MNNIKYLEEYFLTFDAVNSATIKVAFSINDIYTVTSIFPQNTADIVLHWPGNKDKVVFYLKLIDKEPSWVL